MKVMTPLTKQMSLVKDERYPVFMLYDDKPGSHDKAVELDVAFLARYRAAEKEYELVQDELEKLFNKA